MSSVTRFIRQTSPAHQYFTVPAGYTGAAAYEFVAAAGNTVGNYPPGYVQTASAALIAAVTAAASTSVFRDMGKTIRAPIGSLTGSVAFFRQVQMIAPAPLASYTGAFGVQGAPANPDALTNYLTFYVPIAAIGSAASVAGIVSAASCQQ
jgi:hypothetical protein